MLSSLKIPKRKGTSLLLNRKRPRTTAVSRQVPTSPAVLMSPVLPVGAKYEADIEKEELGTTAMEGDEEVEWTGCVSSCLETIFFFF